MGHLYECMILVSTMLMLFALGGPAALFFDKKNCLILALPLGFAIAGILTTALYICSVAVDNIRLVLVIVSCFGAFLSYRQKVSFNFLEEKWTILVYLSVLSIMIIPSFIGGNQFSVFQGNIWDHFSYLAGSVIYSKYNYQELVSLSNAQLLKDPLLIIARANLDARPTVFILFSSLFLLGAKATLTILSYIFLAVSLSFCYLTTLYFIRMCQQVSSKNELDAKQRFFSRIIPAAFPLGFWGQYTFDINAWSQIAAANLLILYVAFSAKLIGLFLSKEYLAKEAFTRSFLATNLVLCASVLIYPENTIIHVAAIVFGVLILRAKGFVSNKLALILPFILSVGLLGVFINYSGVALFLYKQLIFGATGDPGWWTYYDAYLFGRTDVLAMREHWAPGAISAALYWVIGYGNYVLGAMGLYFITPLDIGGAQRAFAISLFYVVLGITFIGLMQQSYVCLKKSLRANLAIFFAAFIAFWAAVIFYLLFKSQHWSAGKALSFVAPYLILAITLSPTMIKSPQMEAARRWSWVPVLRLLVFVYALFSIAQGFRRLDNALTNSDGIIYPGPYPAVQHDESKLAISWELDQEKLSTCKSVQIDLAEPFQRYFLQLIVSYLNKPYFFIEPVNTYFGVGQNIGNMPVIPTDCMVYLAHQANQKSRFVVEAVDENESVNDRLDQRYFKELAEGIDFRIASYPDFVVEVTGMSSPENWGRWTDGNTGAFAKFRFKRPFPKKLTLEISANAFGPNSDKPIKVRIGTVERSMVIRQGDIAKTYALDFDGINEADTIEIEPPAPMSPAQLNIGADARKLGVGIISIKVRL